MIYTIERMGTQNNLNSGGSDMDMNIERGYTGSPPAVQPVVYLWFERRPYSHKFSMSYWGITHPGGHFQGKRPAGKQPYIRLRPVPGYCTGPTPLEEQ